MNTTIGTISNARKPLRGLVAWIAAGWVATIPTFGASPSAAKQHYEAGRYAEAQTEYQKLLREKPDDSRLSYNAATAAYKHGDLTNATLGFENALATQDLKLQQKAYYNLGNTRFQMGNRAQSPEEKMSLWEESLKDFGSALKLQPEDADAKHNQSVVQQMLEELKKQMPKQKQKNPNQNKDDKKDDSKDQDKDKDQNQDSKDKQDSKDQESKDQKQNSDSEKQDSEQKDKESQQGKDSKGDDEKKEQEQESKSGEGKDDKDKDKDKQGKPSEAASKSDAQAKKEAEEERQAAALGKMTPQMAEKLLDAQKGNEKAMLFRVQQQRPKGKDRVFKNW